MKKLLLLFILLVSAQAHAGYFEISASGSYRKTTYDEMLHGLEIAIHQFAKRQMTWFRGMERRGFVINWIDACLPMEEKVNTIKKILNL